MLTGLVSDYLFEQRIRQDSLSVEKLATTLAPFFSSADTDALQESIVSEGGDMGGRLLLTDTEGKVQLDSYAALLGVRLELPQVVAALTQSTGSAYGIHPLMRRPATMSASAPHPWCAEAKPSVRWCWCPPCRN